MAASTRWVRRAPSPLAATVRVAATGRAGPEEVWARYAVPARWPEWSPQIRRVDTADPDAPVGVGTRGVVRGPVGAAVPFEVTEVDGAARRWTWRVRAGFVPLHLEHGVDPAGAGARAWVRISGPFPMVAAYAPLAHLALRRLVADVPSADRVAGPG